MNEVVSIFAIILFIVLAFAIPGAWALMFLVFAWGVVRYMVKRASHDVRR